MKTAISIPDPIFEAAEQAAKRLSMTRSQLYTKAIQQFLEAHKDEKITEKLDEVYAEEDSSLDPVIEQLQSLSLPEERW